MTDNDVTYLDIHLECEGVGWRRYDAVSPRRTHLGSKFSVTTPADRERACRE